jgi:hypothetical protein
MYSHSEQLQTLPFEKIELATKLAKLRLALELKHF